MCLGETVALTLIGGGNGAATAGTTTAPATSDDAAITPAARNLCIRSSVVLSPAQPLVRRGPPATQGIRLMSRKADGHRPDWVQVRLTVLPISARSTARPVRRSEVSNT